MEILLESWNEGFQKVCLTKLQMDLLKLSLKESKNNVDNLLDGKKVIIRINDIELGNLFIKEINKIGVNAVILE
ncbi:hypothetical protein [Empedobacter brevis]|uniref:hypothetical protein n=1 Tax=Empedobacter brevis TaxID=247 RepID=UPI00289DF1D0|nr:hypothetical protein [Empedobacter brevis]